MTEDGQEDQLGCLLGGLGIQERSEMVGVQQESKENGKKDYTGDFLLLLSLLLMDRSVVTDKNGKRPHSLELRQIKWAGEMGSLMGIRENFSF